jgi:hypothetical protein
MVMPTDENPRRPAAIPQNTETKAILPSEDKTAFPKTLWAFVNSSFGLFFLSSVVVGLLSFSYTQWRDYKTSQHSIEQLDLEIALRLHTMDRMCGSAENRRYSNFVNIDAVVRGDPKPSFYVRKPLFNTFENKNLTTLLWQLYLLVPSGKRGDIRGAIRGASDIIERMRQVRFSAANDYNDARPNPRTKKAQEKKDDEDDKFKKEYGQSDVYRRVHILNENARWKDVGF